VLTLSEKKSRLPQEDFRAGSLGYDLWSYNAFATQVEYALDGQHLRYSKRLRLIKRAEELGIRRFDANLIIALVQHRAKPVIATVKPSAKPRRKFPIAGIACFAIIQSAIFLAAWWMIS
jgi:hypothetical protein